MEKIHSNARVSSNPEPKIRPRIPGDSINNEPYVQTRSALNPSKPVKSIHVDCHCRAGTSGGVEVESKDPKLPCVSSHDWHMMGHRLVLVEVSSLGVVLACSRATY